MNVLQSLLLTISVFYDMHIYVHVGCLNFPLGSEFRTSVLVLHGCYANLSCEEAIVYNINFKYSLEHRAAHALGHLVYVHIFRISRASYALWDSYHAL